MKKSLMAIALACGVVLGSSLLLFSNPNKNKTFESSMKVDKWNTSKNGVWVGKDGITYALNYGIWMSFEGKKWVKSHEGIWRDVAGNFVKIQNKQILLSKDGVVWYLSPDGKWQGKNGMWYKFDKNWVLMELK